MTAGGKNNISWAKKWENVPVQMLHILDHFRKMVFYSSQISERTHRTKDSRNHRYPWRQDSWKLGRPPDFVSGLNIFETTSVLSAELDLPVLCRSVKKPGESAQKNSINWAKEAVCNNSVCVPALKALLVIFEKGYLILKDVWIVAIWFYPIVKAT